MELTKIRVLVLVPYYLPGYRAGGPLRTVANMVDHLSDRCEFFIITLDRDFGDIQAYPEVISNQWQTVGNSKVYYISPNCCTILGFKKVISNISCDILYLNSFFNSDFTLKPLIARKLGWLNSMPTIIAPRGEFSAGALEIKSLKKRVYIMISKILGIYSGMIWHASSQYEAAEIVRAMHINLKNIQIALDLPQKEMMINHQAFLPNNDEIYESPLRIIFLSRICPKKNLDYALKVLSKVRSPVVFDIYGPLEDLVYWRKCQILINQLPDNISAQYLGTIEHHNVSQCFSRYDLFFFPTRGENYGHVIAESLLAGTSVLISDQTPWRNLELEKFGLDLSLNNPAAFVQAIEQYSFTSSSMRLKLRSIISSSIYKKITDPKVLEANQELFVKRLY